MTQAPKPTQLPWLKPHQPFPAADQAWGADTPAAGLLAAGGVLDTATLVQAYTQGIFPWFGPNEPIMWWSPNPRMVLPTQQFRFHRSLRKQIQNLLHQGRLDIRVDTAFDEVIQACATQVRMGQHGTWIVDSMVNAYNQLHHDGFAHSIETWIDGQLQGGLYVVNMGHMVYGESMFSLCSNASKIALSALVAICRLQHAPYIDCQQQTAHLQFMGAAPIDRAQFLHDIEPLTAQAPMKWAFDPTDWQCLFSNSATGHSPRHLHVE